MLRVREREPVGQILLFDKGFRGARHGNGAAPEHLASASASAGAGTEQAAGPGEVRSFAAGYRNAKASTQSFAGGATTCTFSPKPE